MVGRALACAGLQPGSGLSIVLSLLPLLLAATLSIPLAAQEWRFYGGDPGGSKYSKLDHSCPKQFELNEKQALL